MKLTGARLLIIIHAAVFFLLCVYGYSGYSACGVIKDDLAEWKCNYASYDDGFRAVPEIKTGSDEYMDFLYGPYIELPKGSYTAKIDYETESDQWILAFSDKPENAFIKGDRGYLRRTNHSALYPFETGEDLEAFELKVLYNGRGELKIKSLSIERDMRMCTRNILNLVLLILFADLVLLMYKKGRLREFLTPVILALVTSVPLMVYGLNYGHDLNFHLDRIEGIVSSLVQGQFPVRLETFWMGGYGYPTSVFYGSTLLYVAAFLRLCGYPLMAAYKAYIFTINLLTAFVCVWCFKRIFKDEMVSAVLTFAYLGSTYRMVDIYNRAAVGEYTAIVFFPIFGLALYRMYCFDKTEKTVDIIKNAILLCAGMSGLIQSHLLSVEMVCLILVLICAATLLKSIRKGVIISYAVGALFTLGLNLWFIVPFFDYYKNVPVVVTEGIKNDTLQLIQGDGAYIGQYFAFRQSIYGWSYIDVNERMNYSPGSYLMLPLVALILYFLIRLVSKDRTALPGLLEDEAQAGKRMVFLSVFSVLCLYVASDLFPWDKLALMGKAGIILCQVQFPWRYIAMAILPLTLLLGELLCLVKGRLCGGNRYRLIAAGLTLMIVFSLTDFTSSYFDGIGVGEYYSEANIYDSSLVNGEFMRAGSRKDNLKDVLYADEMDEASILQREDGAIHVHAKTSGGGLLGFPVFNYKGYTVTSDDGKEYEIEDGPNNIVAVRLESGFDGNLWLEFAEPSSWIFSEALSLISFIGLAALCVLIRLRPNLSVKMKVV